MAKYWVKENEQVQGPYELMALKFLPNFKEETFVSIDDPLMEEIWQKAVEINEISNFLHPVSIPVKNIPILELRNIKNDPFLQTEKTQSNVPPHQPVSIQNFEMESSPSVPDIQSFPKSESDISEVLNSFPNALQSQPDIQESIQLKQRQTSNDFLPPPPSAQEEIQKSSAQSESIEIYIPTPRLNLNSKKSLVLISFLFLSILGGVGFYLYQLKMFSKKAVAEKEQVLLSEPKKKKPIFSSTKKQGSKAKKTAKEISAPVIQKVVSATFIKTVEDEKLKTQKFLLPGVPSPNVREIKKSDPSNSSEKTEVEPLASETEKDLAGEIDKNKKIEKQKKTEKKELDDLDWMNQTGWGK